MTAHTPGPWHVIDGGIWVDCANNKPVALISCRHGVERDANAALIAAAPDLLAALKGLMAHSHIADSAAEDKDAEDHDAERAARAAIAKAGGRP